MQETGVVRDVARIKYAFVAVVVALACTEKRWTLLTKAVSVVWGVTFTAFSFSTFGEDGLLYAGCEFES